MSFNRSFSPSRYQRVNRALNDDDIRALAPSIFAQQPITGVSSRYSFIPTASILDGLRDAGWQVVDAKQQPVRNQDRQGFQKHVLRVAQTHALEKIGEYRFEVSILNSHDKSSAYKVQAGLLRTVCLNGLLTSEDTVGSIRIAHYGFDPSKVIDATLEVARHAQDVTREIEAFKARTLSEPEVAAFASGAHTLRWNEPNTAPIQPATLLAPRRHEDQGNNCWSVFNRVQENLTQGGQRGRTAHGKRTRTRSIKGIDEDAKLNRALWAYAKAIRDGNLPTEAPLEA
jgi:hypothetical protein